VTLKLFRGGQWEPFISTIDGVAAAMLEARESGESIRVRVWTGTGQQVRDLTPSEQAALVARAVELS
jgi:hypothetical protein